MTDEELLKYLESLVTPGRRHPLTDLLVLTVPFNPLLKTERVIAALGVLARAGKLRHIYHVGGQDFASFMDIPNQLPDGSPVLPENIVVYYEKVNT